MTLDQAALEALRRQHPAWRLLAADSAALVASFLHRVFVVPNMRTMAQSDLAEALEAGAGADRLRLPSPGAGEFRMRLVASILTMVAYRTRDTIFQ